MFVSGVLVPCGRSLLLRRLPLRPAFRFWRSCVVVRRGPSLLGCCGGFARLGVFGRRLVVRRPCRPLWRRCLFSGCVGLPLVLALFPSSAVVACRCVCRCRRALFSVAALVGFRRVFGFRLRSGLVFARRSGVVGVGEFAFSFCRLVFGAVFFCAKNKFRRGLHWAGLKVIENFSKARRTSVTILLNVKTRAYFQSMKIARSRASMRG